MIMSNRLVLIILLITLLVIPGIPGVTSHIKDNTTIESDSIVIRKPNQQFTENYLTQKEFIYTEPPVGNTFFSQLLDSFLNWLNKWGSFSIDVPFPLTLLIWAIIILMLFFLIIKTKLYRIFYTNREIDSPEFRITTNENLLVDYDHEIQQQVEQQQFRNATRLLFLKLISILQNKELIHFSKDKTNYDYLNELSDNNLKSRFRSLIFIYCHVWYGNTEIAEDQYLRFEKSFQSFYLAVNVQE